MPRVALEMETELTTRSTFSKVDCELTLTVNGRELPNTAVLGDALEKAFAEVQRIVTESYATVPERV